jgi:DNA-binding transcriptional ArsR family regulator
MAVMNEESIFLEHVGDNPRMRTLQYFIEGRDFDYTLTDLLNAGVSWGTLNTLVPKLLELGIVIKTRKIGRATLYKINQKNIAVKQLVELYDNLLLEKLNKLENEIVVPA